MTKLNRRHFLIASGLGLNVWVPVPGLNLSYGQGSSPKRRHLINIQGFGGWDSTWHHSPMLEKEIAGMKDDEKKNSFYGDYYSSPRFPDDKAISFNGSQVGIGWSAFTAQDAKDILIWRGINPAASHDIGNRYTQCGSLSGYAASYSVLIAKALAQSPDYLRPLHYVQTTGTPSTFRSQVGFVTGAGVPINIATYSDWVKLSASDLDDPVESAGLNGLYDELFKSFLEPSSKMKAAAARKFKDEFKPSYEAAAKTRNKNFATDPQYKFQEIMDSYKAAIVDDISKVLFGDGGAFALEGLKDLKALPTSASGVGAFIEAAFTSQTLLDNILYPLAVAEFLVTQDLSAVVDCTVKLGDRHNGNNLDFLEVMVATAAFRKLMGTLRGTALSAGSSQSLLDVTTIVLSTEFDRTVHRYPQDPARSPGTNHGSTVSMVLAGYGVNGGKIIGARGTGPEGTYGGLGNANRFDAPLPIDLKTGQPSASGVVVDNGAVQPTILKIFGLAQPTQQFIGAPTVAAVIKPGHKG